jgi:hypothetical protein
MMFDVSASYTMLRAYHRCGESCFAGTAMSKGGQLPSIPVAIIIHYGPNEFKASFSYNYRTNLSSQQAEVITNHENVNVINIGQGEARHNKTYKRLELDGGETYDRSSD